MSTSTWQQRIVIDANMCHGKPVIRGLRYPVESILELMASGMTFEQILEDYPDLEREDLLACLQYAVKMVRTEKLQELVR
ncbi:MAG: DUF433 domain-containing protein [Firmicutes bacterium]|nr:DUF433 domain-containing protein [Bacillota bacterium]